jgi:hypothetical protein
MWEGGDVWILGGGPSLPKQFDIPDKVVNSVINGNSPPSVYSSYMEAIHTKHVIGINVSFLIGDWIDIVFFGDSNFFSRYKNDLAVFKGLRVCCDPQAGKENWVKFLARDAEHSRGISPDRGKVGWNHNSGAAAISLAVHTGAKRIILLGFDMKLADNNMQHWHDLYGKGEVTNPRTIQKLPFERHLRGFGQIKKDADKLGVEIINCSPQSMITDFRKMTIKELLYDNS